jgi:hypothetical protein
MEFSGWLLRLVPGVGEVGWVLFGSTGPLWILVGSTGRMKGYQGCGTAGEMGGLVGSHSGPKDWKITPDCESCENWATGRVFLWNAIAIFAQDNRPSY